MRVLKLLVYASYFVLQMLGADWAWDLPKVATVEGRTKVLHLLLSSQLVTALYPVVFGFFFFHVDLSVRFP